MICVLMPFVCSRAETYLDKIAIARGQFRYNLAVDSQNESVVKIQLF